MTDIQCTRLDLSSLFPGKRDAFALVLDNVFSEGECKKLIDRTEELGYAEALVGGQQVRQTQQRNNWRCIVDDPDLAASIFARVKLYVPYEWLGFKLVGLNERLRFLKYKPGEYFKPHNDGVYVRDDSSECSFVTLHLYLSDVAEGDGGETTFTTEKMTYGRHVNRHKDDTVEVKRLSVRPVTGRVLLFGHHNAHEGSTLLSGVKYTMRTDCMYDLAGKAPIRTPRWGTEFPHPQYKLHLPA